ncbi:hypothetical protein ENUP19_0003G0006 [Entamoeba nuttalli]|uniref:mannose-6-phosphate isomerase n=2 Tax=Entamoeba nuttalli TaxID=412467 RepID=K2H470_ENTNP|nr:phosphomannose isomerase type I protein [Entamoeba nuttalli P19]EKE41112.1 phosphomannose isomerase type I protein [Entamoeba nuttalli P19]|eukprot:XP_008856552.1 phosphomannose isomerase type I protein [Entamoeba nuttalli P19]
MAAEPSHIQRIQGRVQHYEWGRDKPCLVSSLSELENGPYAEIWYGSHSRLPSFLFGTNEPIDIKLPFLLKFLSIKNPLSLQIHPDASTAEILFKKDPIHYVDANAKPEICIPLSQFHCFLGFVDEELLLFQMKNNPPLVEVLNYKEGEEARTLLVRAHLLEKSKVINYINEMSKYITSLIQNGKTLSKHQILFNKLVNKFKNDVGLIVCFLLRYEIFEPYHAFFIPPNYPHGYIEGECVEAMVSSDNVIRFGLTHKFCDLEALQFIPHETCNRISEVDKEILTIRSDDYQAAQSIRYINPKQYLNSFIVTVYHINKGFTIDVSILSTSLFVLYKGKARIENSIYQIGAAFLIKDRNILTVNALDDVSLVLLS